MRKGVEYTAAAYLGKSVHAYDASLRVDSEEGGNKTSNEVIVICRRRRRLAFGLWHVFAKLKEVIRVILRNNDIYVRSLKIKS
jgi:hypothetical protein